MPESTRRVEQVAVAGAILALAWLSLLGIAIGAGDDAELRARLFVPWLAVGLPVWIAAWVWIAGRWWSTDHESIGHWRVVLVAAGVLQMAGALAPPILSDDVYRYVWEGRVVLLGENPFLLAPSDPRLSMLAQAIPEIHSHVNNPDLPAIYPPAAQYWFTTVSSLTASERLMRLSLAVVAALVPLLFLRYLLVAGLPTGRAVLLACHPLMFLESGLGGHVDVLLLAAVVLLLIGLRRHVERSGFTAAVAGMAAAVLLKLAPVVMLPIAARHFEGRKRRVVFVTIVLVAVLVAYAPFAHAGARLFDSLKSYNWTWEFNGPVQPLILRAWTALDPDGGLVDKAINGIGAVVGVEGLSVRLRSTRGFEPVHPAQFASRITVGLLVVALCLWAFFRVGSFEQAWLLVVGGGLLLSPIVHPWYLLALLPVAFGGSVLARGAMAWTLVVPLAYAVLPGWWTKQEWQLPTWVKVVEYGVVAGVMLGACSMSRGFVIEQEETERTEEG